MKYLVLYRDNEIFSEYVPQILSLLEERGDIALKTFSAGTSEEEIGEELKKILPFDDVVLVCDGTCHFIVETIMEDEYGLDIDGGKAEANHQKIGVKHFVNLDTVVSNTIKKTTEMFTLITGEDLENVLTADEHLEDMKAFFLILKKMLLDFPEKKPEKVFVFSPHMNNHSPFCFDDDTEECAKIVCGVFKRLNIPVEMRTSFSASEVDKRGNWIILDRHYYYKLKWCLPLKEAQVFNLPEYQFLDEAIEQGFIKKIEVEDDKIRRAITSALEESLSTNRS